MTSRYPTTIEQEFLDKGYNRFLDLYEHIMSDNFWRKKAEIRLCLIKDIFSVYTEIIQYEPIRHLITNSKRPHYQLVGKDLMKFVRNITLHFPFFERWDEIKFTRSLILTFKSGNSSIDTFLRKASSEEIKYRYMESNRKRMTYISIRIPSDYIEGKEVYMKQIISEKEGVKFCILLMREILMSEVESIKS